MSQFPTSLYYILKNIHCVLMLTSFTVYKEFIYFPTWSFQINCIICAKTKIWSSTANLKISSSNVFPRIYYFNSFLSSLQGLLHVFTTISASFIFSMGCILGQQCPSAFNSEFKRFFKFFIFLCKGDKPSVYWLCTKQPLHMPPLIFKTLENVSEK